MSRHTRTLLWAWAAAVLVWGAAVLSLSTAGQSLDVFFLTFYGGIGFVAVALGVAAALLVAAKRRGTHLPRAFPLPFVLSLLVLAAVFAALVIDLPTRAAFSLSREPLQSTAVRVQAGATVAVPARIGVLTVSRIDRSGDAVRFVVGEVGMGDHVGYVYSPHGRPAAVGEDVYDPLGGPWWAWFESW